MDASPNQNWGKNSNEDEDMEPLLEIFNNQGKPEIVFYDKEPAYGLAKRQTNKRVLHEFKNAAIDCHPERRILKIFADHFLLVGKFSNVSSLENSENGFINIDQLQNQLDLSGGNLTTKRIITFASLLHIEPISIYLYVYNS